MKRLIVLIMVATLLVPAVALASDITGAKWYSVITVSNNSTEAADVFTTFPLSTQNLIDTNFLSENLTDCAMHDTSGTDTAFMPAVNATYPWCLYVGNIGEDAFRNYLLYTGGNADMDGKIRYFPGVGGMTVADAATLELSDNFTIEMSGWTDTDNNTDKNFVYKIGSARVFVSDTVSGNISVSQVGVGAPQNEAPRRPDGHDTCVIPLEAGAACNNHYQNVDEAAPNDADWVGAENDAAFYIDIYTLQDTTIGADSTINSVTATIRGRGGSGPGGGDFWVGLKLGANYVQGTKRTPGVPFTTYNQALARPGGGSWQQSDLDALLITVKVQAGAGATNAAKVSWAYITVNYSDPVDTVLVSATGVSSGEHTILVSANTTHIWIAIDSVIKDTAVLPGAFADTASGWTFIENYSMPYMEYLKIWKAGS